MIEHKLKFGFWMFTLLTAILLLLLLLYVGVKPELLASAGWHELASVGWVT